MEASRLLVVDDSLTIRRALEFILKPQGYDLRFAADGREALDHAISFKPDLILLDYVLPDMRGPDVCAALVATPETSSTPVILVSAKGATIRQAYQDAQNVVSYITKPFKAQVVLSVVDNALAHRRTGASAAPADVPEVEPRIEAAPSKYPSARAATMEETFGALLAHLEDAVSSRAAAAALEPQARAGSLTRLGTPLRRARELLHQMDLHLEGGNVAPYRLDRHGSFSNIATTLLETHRLLCEAALALASAGAPGPSLPAPPRLLAACPKTHPSHRELDALVRSRAGRGALLIDCELASLPWLVQLVRPDTLVACPGASEVLDRSLRATLATLPPGTRLIGFVGAGETLAPEWQRFEVRVSTREELETAVADLVAHKEPNAAEHLAVNLEVVSL